MTTTPNHFLDWPETSVLELKPDDRFVVFALPAMTVWTVTRPVVRMGDWCTVRAISQTRQVEELTFRVTDTVYMEPR